MDDIHTKIVNLAEKIETQILLDNFYEAEHYQKLLDALVRYAEATANGENNG